MAGEVIAGDIVRFLGLLSAGIAVGALIVVTKAAPGTTGFRVPWRYWAGASGLLYEFTWIVDRVAAVGRPLSYLDVSFLVVNVCVSIAAIGTLTQGPPERRSNGKR